MQKSKISALQMAMLLYPTIIATAILSAPSMIAQYAQNDLWLSPILASLIGFLTVYLAVRLHKLFPEHTIIQASEQIIGRIPGKFISLIFLFFYIQATGEITRAYSEFIAGSFLFKTPIIVIIGSMVLLCAFVVYGGVEVLGRVGQLFFPVFIVPLILLIILLSPDFQIGNILPILEGGILPPIKGAIVFEGWFTEFLLITFLLPFLTDMKKGLRYGMMAVLIVMFTLVIVNLIVLFVLGSTTASKIYPLMNVSRYASLGAFFENLESVTMAVWIIGMFMKISVFYYAIALGTAQWFNLTDYRPLVLPLGILIIEFSFWGIPSTMNFSSYETNVFPFYAIFVQTLIPLILLVIAVFRKKNKREEG